MKKYLKEYVNYLESMIQNHKKCTEKEMQEIVCKIQFFQHERLIHLLVTIAFSFFTLFFMAFGMLSYLFLIPFFIFIAFLILYILHYFYLENHIQYLYKLYDQIGEFSRK